MFILLAEDDGCGNAVLRRAGGRAREGEGIARPPTRSRLIANPHHNKIFPAMAVLDELFVLAGKLEKASGLFVDEDKKAKADSVYRLATEQLVACSIVTAIYVTRPGSGLASSKLTSMRKTKSFATDKKLMLPAPSHSAPMELLRDLEISIAEVAEEAKQEEKEKAGGKKGTKRKR